jgi:protein-disulfide isomerase
VQLVVFSDFQCAHCARLAPVLRRVREEFPREVRVAYRYFPLEANPRAVPAAVAAQCAAEQGRFWEYHDKLFAEGGDLSDTRLVALADATSLNREKFSACVTAGAARKIVEASHADAVKLGLEGAPALFLDGTMIGGYVAPDDLVRMIRQRLDRK